MSKIAGLRQKRPEKSHPPTNPTKREKSKNDGWEQTGPADGGSQDPVIISSYSGHIVGCIWRGQDRGILKSRTISFEILHVPTSELLLAICFCGEVAMTVTLHDVELILGVPSYCNVVDHYYSQEQIIAVIHSDLDISDSSIGINAQDLAGVADSPRSGLSTEQRAAYYVFGNNVPRKLWPLVKNAWIYLYFPMFAPPVRAGVRLCKPHIQRFAMLGHKTKNKLIYAFV
ncbi:hypothetical protein M9H77_36686 [Catharanthus roseus]|uniref:Uncharacterized protein n=1 Tax=Catharanthus roseus TaxID=4058 RepID=A0ACB9ZV36_CATRO|nr:hypothetical protein M9H77_36686 [Catharanthus roseus]